VPDHERLRELLAALGHGLTATSANRSGEEPIVDPRTSPVCSRAWMRWWWTAACSRAGPLRPWWQ